MKSIGVVVPTLFERGELLKYCLESVRSAGPAFVILMGPNVVENGQSYAGLVDQLMEEPRKGSLSSKLNEALSAFPSSVELITWIGDDDVMSPNSLKFSAQEFHTDQRLALVYGQCDYIDVDGEKIGVNKSGSWALGLARFGPFLAPQPGSLFRRQAFESIGGLDPTLSLAFDFDLFMSLRKHGGTKYLSKRLASFRWHPASLSVQNRKASAREASIVRIKHSRESFQPFLKILNPIVELMTVLAGTYLSFRLRRFSGRV